MTDETAVTRIAAVLGAHFIVHSQAHSASDEGILDDTPMYKCYCSEWFDSPHEWCLHVAHALLASGVVVGTDLTQDQLLDLYEAAEMDELATELVEIAQRQASEGAAT